jgi:ABC-type transport system involved in multi-copper enzyme maturation permease subunit
MISEAAETKKVGGRLPGFLAIIRYELLWNIRKKKFLAMVAIALAITIIPLVLSALFPRTANPDFVIASGGINSFETFLFALVTVMNSVSSEFESGTIVPLVTKPVSRTTVFLGKVAAAIITLIPVYVLIYIILSVGGIFVYGPQNNLYLAPLLFLGNILSTLVWLAIVLALGSVTKSTLFTAIVPFLIFIVLSIAEPIIGLLSGQASILTYLPGSGNSGYLVSSNVTSIPLTTSAVPTSVATGTDGIARTLVAFFMHPSYLVAFAKIGGLSSLSGNITLTVTSTEPLSLVLLTAVGVVFAYVFAFLLIGWFAFKRAQISQ